ncbi:hypothetical protein ABMA28_008453 [Loxostege sticticalis]|uniref:Peptidase S1 domain-containing protein n=1 Tax=Loxostege sticticalis TaxID=481309 RepID=A0ABD0SI43_LOXSC
MASLFVVVLALFAAAAASPSRIIGGNPTRIENYPSVVQVESLNFGIFWTHSCAGSILNSIFILSAAHCFSGTAYAPENRRIRAGATNLESGGVIVHIAQEINHPSYGLNGNDGDISVVRLSSALILTPNNPSIAVGSIVAAGSTMFGNMPVTKVGWGITEIGGEFAPQLQEARVVVVDRQLCAFRYSSLSSAPEVTENMFCAGTATADACDGDGGAPVFFTNIVVGVVSWGNGCLQPGFPGVNTAVSNYTPWIMAVTAAN